MVVITINVPEKDLKFLDALASTELFPSRSEAIRFCIRNTMPTLLDQVELMEVFTKEVMTKREVQQFNLSQDTQIIVPKNDYDYSEGFKEYKVLRRLE